MPGDRIVGIVTTGKGVTIHTIDCETLETFADTPERWLDVAWDVDPDSMESHVGRLSVVITNQPGSLGSLTTVIGKNAGNINNLKIVNRSTDFFEVLVDVEVKDARASRSRPDLGIVTFGMRVRNAAGQVLLEATSPIMVKRRDAAAAG